MKLAPASELIRRNLDAVEGRVLLLNPPPDSLADLVSDQPAVDHVTAFSQFYADHRHHPAHDRATRCFGAEPVLAHPIDLAVVFLSREKQRTQMLLHQAVSTLSGEGVVWLVGENRAGIKSAGRLMAPFVKRIQKRDSARHCVLLQGHRAVAVQPFELGAYQSVFEATVRDGAIALASYPGVFSHGELDAATRLLLDHLDPRYPLLDFGCGCGVLATWATRSGGPVTAADTDALALAATRETLALNDASAEVIPCDGWHGIEAVFDQVITNPPFHRGVKTDYRTTEGLISGLPRHLAARGDLWLVANAFLDYPERIRATLGNCRTVTETRQFRVYHARRSN